MAHWRAPRDRKGQGSELVGYVLFLVLFGFAAALLGAIWPT